MCGPDAEIEGQKLTSSFLDLSKIKIDEYVGEGLLICIKWYQSVLDERQNKKDNDFMKKLKTTYEEIEKYFKEVQQASLLIQDDSEASRVFQDAEQIKT